MLDCFKKFSLLVISINKIEIEYATSGPGQREKVDSSITQKLGSKSASEIRTSGGGGNRARFPAPTTPAPQPPHTTASSQIRISRPAPGPPGNQDIQIMIKSNQK